MGTKICRKEKYLEGKARPSRDKGGKAQKVVNGAAIREKKQGGEVTRRGREGERERALVIACHARGGIRVKHIIQVKLIIRVKQSR